MSTHPSPAGIGQLPYRSVLRYHHARVSAVLGDLDRALAGMDAAAAADPHAECHLDRGELTRRAGRLAAAVAAYGTALRSAPPCPRPRCDRAGPGVAGLSYLPELEPEQADAELDRAALLLAGGEVEAARAAVAVLPASPHAACLRGQLAQHDGDHAGAQREFGAALAVDPELTAAWAGRAVSRHAVGDLAGAAADLDRAVELGADAAAYFHRGLIRQARGDWARSVMDFTAALELGGPDPDALYQRGRSHLHLGRARAGYADLARAAELPPGRHRPELVELLRQTPAAAGAA